jgi:hypothetical protein
MHISIHLLLYLQLMGTPESTRDKVIGQSAFKCFEDGTLSCLVEDMVYGIYLLKWSSFL